MRTWYGFLKAGAHGHYVDRLPGGDGTLDHLESLVGSGGGTEGLTQPQSVQLGLERTHDTNVQRLAD